MPEKIKLASFDHFFSWLPLYHKAIISQPSTQGWVLPLSSLFALASFCVVVGKDSWVSLKERGLGFES